MRAAPADLDQVFPVKGSIRGDDSAAGGDFREVPDKHALDFGGHIRARFKGFQSPVRIVKRLVKCRHINTRNVAGQGFQKRPPVSIEQIGGSGIKKSGKDGFCFSDEKTIDKICDRFRVGKKSDPPCNNQRVGAISVTGSQGESGLFENRQKMGEVIFKRNRKGDDVKIA